MRKRVIGLAVAFALCQMFMPMLVMALESSPGGPQSASVEDAPEAALASLYTASGADDFASKLIAMAQAYEETLGTAKSGLPDSQNEYASARLLVRTDGNLTGIEKYNPTQTITDGNGFYAVQFRTAENAKACGEYLHTLSTVQYAEPDRILTLGPGERSGADMPLLPTNPPLSWGVSGTKMDIFAALLKKRAFPPELLLP